MIRRLSLVLLVVLLGACASPFASAPTPSPSQVTQPTATQDVLEYITQLPIETPPPAPTRAEVQPTAAPTQVLPTVVPVDLELIDDPERIAATSPAVRDQVALAEAFEGVGEIPRVARTEPLDVQVGDIETFWVSNMIDNTNYEVEAELRYAGPVVLMYVDTRENVSQAAIERSAKIFEEQIYPRTREVFGEEVSPGVDGDPRLTVLNTPLEGAGGYFSPADMVVKAANRFSNEREMFVIGINSYPLGTEAYASTLAHEFQHMIQANVAQRSPSWFNEGMSQLAEDINGFTSNGTAQLALLQPDVQLTTWSSDAAQTGEHYGTSHLFMRYFYDQYGGEDSIAELIARDAGNNLEVFADIARRTRPDITSFADLYADWAVANVLGDSSVGDGRYNYELLPGTASIMRVGPGVQEGTVNQFGVDYLGVLEGPQTLNFTGNQVIGLTGASPYEGRYMWWSQRGDDSIETLTREFDLSGLDKATLKFSTWYEIEKDWDYGFVTVSTDGGKTWTTLEGKSTTTEDPQGHNYGHGLTGVSGKPGVETDKGIRAEWIDEEMDLTPYVGQKILLRFWVINDAAYNAQGMLIDNISIPELNYFDNAEEGDGGWEGVGFVRTTGFLAQQWSLRLIAATNGELTVTPVEVDAQGRAQIQIPANTRAILAVIASTPFTTEKATYTYEIVK